MKFYYPFVVVLAFGSVNAALNEPCYGANGVAGKYRMPVVNRTVEGR